MFYSRGGAFIAPRNCGLPSLRVHGHGWPLLCRPTVRVALRIDSCVGSGVSMQSWNLVQCMHHAFPHRVGHDSLPARSEAWWGQQPWWLVHLCREASGGGKASRRTTGICMVWALFSARSANSAIKASGGAVELLVATGSPGICHA